MSTMFGVTFLPHFKKSQNYLNKFGRYWYSLESSQCFFLLTQQKWFCDEWLQSILCWIINHFAFFKMNDAAIKTFEIEWFQHRSFLKKRSLPHWVRYPKPWVSRFSQGKESSRVKQTQRRRINQICILNWKKKIERKWYSK